MLFWGMKMAQTSNIEWCDSTFNPWIGCTKVSPACDHCYAEVATPSRTLGVEWGAGKSRYRTSASNWRLPLRWDARTFAQCADCGWRGEWPNTDAGSRGACPRCVDGALVPARRRVFCASLADVFDNEVDPQWRADLFALIAATPNLDWLLLTKRIGNAVNMLGDYPTIPLLPNIWLGITICNQAEADRDVPKLLRLPAAVRFLSIEPMLGPVDLRWAFPDIRTACCHRCGFRTNAVGGTCPNDGETLRGDVGIDWVITGGESGSHARPSNPQWFRGIRDQCAAAGVAHLHKQNGEWVSVSEGEGAGAHHTFADGRTVRRVGKLAAGRKLDGVTHDGYPDQRSKV